MLLLAVEIFLFVIWIWILIAIISDLFRNHKLSGVAKAAWVFFLAFIPFLSALVYLIVRGEEMRDRTIEAQADAKSTLTNMSASRRTPVRPQMSCISSTS